MSTRYSQPAPRASIIAACALAVLGASVPAQSVVASATRLVTGKTIRDGSVEVRDLSRRARAQLRGQRGAAGPRGQAGPQGATGRPGDPGPAGQDAQPAPLEPRRTPTMQNGWFDAGVRFYQDRSGLVHLEGRAVAPATGGPHAGTIFTLPEGYRPPDQLVFVYSAGGALGDLVIEPDGRVRPNSPLPTDGFNINFGALSFRPVA